VVGAGAKKWGHLGASNTRPPYYEGKNILFYWFAHINSGLPAPAVLEPYIVELGRCQS